MCTALAVIGSIMIMKLAVHRLRLRRCGYGGGCGGWHARHHRWHRRWHGDGPRGPINLGDLGDADLDDPRAGARIDVARRVDEVLRGLELNTRQAAEAGDVIAALRGAFGPRYAIAGEILLALRAAGKTPFDTDLAEAALGPRLQGAAGREAREALEHLHNILTEEQRAALLSALR